MKLAKKLAVLGAPFIGAVSVFAEGETPTYDVTTFWTNMNIDFNALISQGATILGGIMIAVVAVALVFRVVTAGISFAKRAFSR